VIPTVIVVGASGSGKTTLIERLVPVLAARGLIVGTVKHASRGFDVDRPGKDSARHFRAGAAATLLVGPEEQVLFRRAQPGRLCDLVAASFADCDLVVAEGFSWERGPKVVVHRRGLAAKERPPTEETLLVVTDEPLGYPVEVAPDALEVIADALARLVETGTGPTAP
jgi:molybdopterin-guanine dinucleotide biosynthesis protein B